MQQSTRMMVYNQLTTGLTVYGTGRTQGGAQTVLVRLAELQTPAATGGTAVPNVYSYSINTALLSKIKSGLAYMWQKARLKGLTVMVQPIQGANAIGNGAVVFDYDDLGAPTDLASASRFTEKVIFPIRESASISWRKQDPSDDIFITLDTVVTKNFNPNQLQKFYIVLENAPVSTQCIRVTIHADLELKDLAP